MDKENLNAARHLAIDVDRKRIEVRGEEGAKPYRNRFGVYEIR